MSKSMTVAHNDGGCYLVELKRGLIEITNLTNLANSVTVVFDQEMWLGITEAVKKMQHLEMLDKRVEDLLG